MPVVNKIRVKHTIISTSPHPGINTEYVRTGRMWVLLLVGCKCILLSLYLVISCYVQEYSSRIPAIMIAPYNSPSGL